MLDRSIHPNTKVMIDAWRRMSADPANHAVGGPNAHEHPGLIGSLFVLQRMDDGAWTFTSAGDEITKLLGRNVTNHDYLSLWSGPDRALMNAFLDAVRLDGAPGVVRGRGETLTGQRVEIELTLMPITRISDRVEPVRMLGLYQTLGGQAMLNGRPVFRHRVSMLVPPTTRTEGPALKLVANH